jgi:hypothetical protein
MNTLFYQSLLIANKYVPKVILAKPTCIVAVTSVLHDYVHMPSTLPCAVLTDIVIHRADPSHQYCRADASSSP